MMKLKKTSELMWLFGVIFVNIGIALCKKAGLGMSMIAAPPFIISTVLHNVSPFFTPGVVEYLFEGLLLIIMCIAVRKFNWRYLLAFAVAVICGYTLDLMLLIFGTVQPESVWLRWLLLLAGDLVCSLGVACFFRTYFPLQVYELFVAEIARKYGFNINKTKRCFDFSLLAVSIILVLTLFGDVTSFDWSTIWKDSFHNIGLGTIVTTIINAYLIALWGKVLDLVFQPTPAFPGLANVLTRK